MPITRIVIDKRGRISIEGIGYKGYKCIEELQKILESLKSYGIEVNIESQQLKAEATTVTIQQTQKVVQ